MIEIIAEGNTIIFNFQFGSQRLPAKSQLIREKPSSAVGFCLPFWEKLHIILR